MPQIIGMTSKTLSYQSGAIAVYLCEGPDKWGQVWRWTRLEEGDQITEGFFERVSK